MEQVVAGFVVNVDDALALEFTFMYSLIEFAARNFYRRERECEEWIDRGGES